MGELELGRSFAPELPDHVEAVLQHFYEAQRKRHQDERDRFERLGLRKSTSRWNRQELYLDETQRAAAMADSRRHLLKHPEWWSPSSLLGSSNSSPLSSAQLRATVAAQHFFQVDCYDVSLPVELRRSEDVYGSSGEDEEKADISEQFLLDAPRSTYVIEGDVMDYAAEQRASNSGETLASALEKDPMAAEHKKTAFTKRLTAAVRHLLAPGQGKPGESTLALLRATTTTLSQSGMASLERACESTQAAVSGGEQLLNYNLKRLSGDKWELTLEVKKVQFRNAIFCSAAAPDADPIMKEFGPGSEFLKSCRLVLGPKSPPLQPPSASALTTSTSASTSSSFPQPSSSSAPAGGGGGGGGGVGVEVDLLELKEEAKLFDPSGARLPWPLPEVLALEVAETPPPPTAGLPARPGRRSFAHRFRFFLGRVFRTCSSLCRRVRLWWARLRGRHVRQQ